MKDIVYLMREKREAWELALERYQQLLALEATGNIKSPPMSGMPSGGGDGDKTYKLLDDIDRARQRAAFLRDDYMLARNVLLASVAASAPRLAVSSSAVRTRMRSSSVAFSSRRSRSARRCSLMSM